uniref:Plasma membrane-associated cation-binding protein 1 n=1 Tax=Oryza meridionalis TaxID=40149 RepID=A0A0E0CJA5_9ORYZ
MDYWKTKVLPKIKVVFAKGGSAKKAAATELIKSFDESKEGINGEFEEKKADLQPKVVEIYEAAPAPLKVLIKDRAKVSGIKKNSAAVTKFVDDLAKIEFPGAKQLSEGIAKVGPALLSGPVFATFEKVSTLLPADEEEIKPKEAPAAAAEEEKKEEAAAAAATDAAGEEKKEEAEEKKEEEAAAPADEPAAAAGESAPAAAEAEPAVEAAATPAAGEAAPAKAEEEEAPKA